MNNVWGYDRAALGLYEIIDVLEYANTSEKIDRANGAWTTVVTPNYAMGAELMVSLLCHIDVNGTDRPNREWNHI